MDAHWWQLPGPGQFGDEILADLRSGRNVILRFPAHADAGVREAVAARVRDVDLWRWRCLSAHNLSYGTPAELAVALYQNLRYQPPDGQLPSAASLARAIPPNDVVWVDGIGEPWWPVWSKFLSQFQHACHAREEHRRGLFCVPLVGHLPAEPEEDTALSVRRWGGRVRRLDVTLYLDRLLPARFPTLLLRQVTLAVAVELAGADPRLAADLAAAGWQFLDNPRPILAARAAERGWTAAAQRPALWGHGLRESLDGEDRPASAALAAAGDWEEVNRRVWHGQVRILYPFIEQQRVRLVEGLNGVLRLPVQTTYGPVDRAIDLEIGQLVHFLRGKRLQDRTWRTLLLLTGMRNALAHLRPVPLSDLIAEELRLLECSG